MDNGDYLSTNDLKDIGKNNNKYTSATPVILDDHGKVTIFGHVGGTDMWDYYGFIAPEDGRANISLSNMTDNLYVRFFTASGRELGGAKPNNPHDKNASYTVEKGKQYFVAIDPYLKADSKYELTIHSTCAADLVPVEVPTDLRDYVGGVTIGDALGDKKGAGGKKTKLADQDVIINGTIGYDTDEYDKYLFTSKETEELTISLIGTTDNIYFSVYSTNGDKMGTTFKQHQIKDNNYDTSLTLNAIKGKSYVVIIDAYYTAESPYSLCIGSPDKEVEKVELPDDTTFEYSDTDIEFNTEYAGRLHIFRPEAYYTVSLPKSDKTFTLDLTDFEQTMYAIIGEERIELPNIENTYNQDGNDYELVIVGSGNYHFQIDLQ